MKAKHRWRVVAEFANGEWDAIHQTVFRVRRRWLGIYWMKRTFNTQEEAIAYAERAALADVPPRVVWPTEDRTEGGGK